MARGRKPTPRAGTLKGTALAALPRCPGHLDAVARKEWRRLANPLFEAGLLTLADRAALAAYAQAYSRWVEAEEQLVRTPKLIRAPSGYAQQSPWIGIANKQMELMGRYMSELGLTPAARTRLGTEPVLRELPKISFVTVFEDEAGNRAQQPIERPGRAPETPVTETRKRITP